MRLMKGLLDCFGAASHFILYKVWSI